MPPKRSASNVLRKSTEYLVRGAINRLNVSLSFFSVILLLISFGLYLHSQKIAEESLVEQTLHRQQAISRSGAKSLELLTNILSDSLVSTASNKNIAAFNLKSNDVLNSFLDGWSEASVVGIIVIDDTGIVRFDANKVGQPNIGENLESRTYFQKSIDASLGDVYFGVPIIAKFGPYEGESIITLSTPIVMDGENVGVLNVGVLLSELTNSFLDPLKISSKTDVFVISSNGDFWYTNYSELKNSNLLTFLEEKSFPGSEGVVKSIRSYLSTPTEGKIDITHPIMFNEGSDSGFRRSLITFSPVMYGDEENYLFLAVITPASDALDFLGPYSDSGLYIIFATLLIIFALSTFIFLVVRFAQKDSYIEGYIYGRDQMIKRPTDKLDDK